MKDNQVKEENIQTEKGKDAQEPQPKMKQEPSSATDKLLAELAKLKAQNAQLNQFKTNYDAEQAKIKNAIKEAVPTSDTFMSTNENVVKQKNPKNSWGLTEEEETLVEQGVPLRFH